MKIRIILALLFACHGFPANAEMLKYMNPRFGYAVSVPEELQPKPSSTNGDGQEWYSESDKISIAVWGGYELEDIETANFQKIRQQSKIDNNVSYFASGADWFVASGINNELIFYQKTLHQVDCKLPTLITLRIEYPKEAKEQLDPMVTEISKSLKKLACPS